MRLSMTARRVLCALSLWLCMAAAQARELVIGGIPEEPVRYLDPLDGTIKGLDVDVLAHILGRLGVPYRVVLELSSARLESNWRQGKLYDMVFTYSLKEERKPYLLYAREAPIYNNWATTGISLYSRRIWASCITRAWKI